MTANRLKEWNETEIATRTQAVYSDLLTRPELAYVSTADYLERRTFFESLCKFSVLEHPIIATIRKRLELPQPNAAVPFGVFDLFVIQRHNMQRLKDYGLIMEWLTVREKVLNDVLTQWDAPRGWKKTTLGYNEYFNGNQLKYNEVKPRPLPTTLQSAYTAFAPAWSAATGKPPCFCLSPMYRMLPQTKGLMSNFNTDRSMPNGNHMDAEEYIARFYSEGGPNGEKVTVGEGCHFGTMARHTAMEIGCRSGATTPEAIETELSQRPLTWETVRLSDLDGWEVACKTIDAEKGKTLQVGNYKFTEAWFEGHGVVFTYKRIHTLGLVYRTTTARGFGEWHLSKGWKTRLKILKQIKAEQDKR